VRCRRLWKAACEMSLEEQHALFGEDLERLKTVPGVGDIVALTAIAVFSDATRFPSAKHASSYAGLVPQTYQSGETNRQGHLTRTGSPELRTMLVQAAHTARRQSSPLNPFDATKLKAHEPRTPSEGARIYRLKPQGAKSRQRTEKGKHAASLAENRVDDPAAELWAREPGISFGAPPAEVIRGGTDPEWTSGRQLRAAKDRHFRRGA
jgi:hypothetical protein